MKIHENRFLIIYSCND